MEKDLGIAFRLATLNVHGWQDGDDIDNTQRVINLVNKHDPDILCLQETYREDQRELEANTAFKSSISLGSCSILSKFDLEEHTHSVKRKRFHRFITGRVTLPLGDDVYVTCIHFDHRLEPMRLKELSEVRACTRDLFEQDLPQIWTGDFNALTREDYSDTYWERNVVEVRERTHWEKPRTELTTEVKKHGFVDTWAAIGKTRARGPIKTCRFDTRIDYVYATPSLLNIHPLEAVRHVDDRASDHNMVIAEFNKNKTRAV